MILFPTYQSSVIVSISLQTALLPNHGLFSFVFCRAGVLDHLRETRKLTLLKKTVGLANSEMKFGGETGRGESGWGSPTLGYPVIFKGTRAL